MAKYFFDERDNGELRPDSDGEEFDNLEAAIAGARKRYEGRFEGPGEGGQEPSFRVEIRTEDHTLPAYILDTASASGSLSP
jgi:hypothetical protein